MTDIIPVPEFGAVPVLETSDLAEGGAEGRANAQAQALTNMIYWLLARGAGTTYSPDVVYTAGAVTVKDGRLQIFDGVAWAHLGQDDGALKIASNLEDLADKAAARAALDVYTTAEVDTMRNAIPLGVVWYWTGNRSAIPDSCMAYDGDVVNRVDFPDLWADIAAGRYPTVSDAVWLASSASRGKFSTGNGSTTFRFPDLNGVKAGSLKSPVLRGDGYSSAGGMLGDAIRDIRGMSARNTSFDDFAGATGAFGIQDEGEGNISPTGVGRKGRLTFAASLTVPTADENRPNSAFGVWIGKVRGGTRSTPATGSPATLLANQFQGGQKIVGPLEVTGGYTGDLLPNVKTALNAAGAAPVYGLRAWVCMDTTTTPITIKASGNIASVTDNGVGDYTLNFAQPMPNAAYALVGGSLMSGGNASATLNLCVDGEYNIGQTLKTPNQVRVGLADASARFDAKEVHVGIIC